MMVFSHEYDYDINVLFMFEWYTIKYQHTFVN